MAQTVMSNMRSFVPMVGAIFLFDLAMDQLEWLPKGSEKAYAEPVAEWLQPGTNRCKLLPLLLLANRVCADLVEQVEDINPYIYMGTFSDLRGCLIAIQEKGIVKGITKRRASSRRCHDGDSEDQGPDPVPHVG